MLRAVDCTRQAGAFNAERLEPPVCVGPCDQSSIAARISDERLIAQADPAGVDYHRDVDMVLLRLSRPFTNPNSPLKTINSYHAQ